MRKILWKNKFNFSMFLTESGKVFACGWGSDGQLGNGTFFSSHIIDQVQGDIAGEKIIKLSCAADCVLALNGKFNHEFVIYINLFIIYTEGLTLSLKIKVKYSVGAILNTDNLILKMIRHFNATHQERYQNAILSEK